jgi:hypothetical protein
METVDLGRKSGISEVSAPDKENKKYYPSMSVPLEMVKGKAIGAMCRFEVVVKVTGMSERENGEGEAQIEVRSAKFLSKAGQATKDEYVKMTEAERDAHDKRMMEREEEDGSDNLDGEE